MKITIKNLQKKIPVNRTKIKKALRSLFLREGLREGEVTVCFVTDQFIRKLNSLYHHDKASTDVLAFNIGFNLKRSIFLADIIVSVDTAIRNATLYKSSTAKEILLYSIHGALHLIGYKDKNPKDIKLMREKENYYVN